MLTRFTGAMTLARLSLSGRLKYKPGAWAAWKVTRVQDLGLTGEKDLCRVSHGATNGVPYLPGFWRDLGPYLPPRNAYLLLRNTVYFDGQGITQYLLVLLGYAVVAGVISSLLGWFRTPRSRSPPRPRSTPRP